MHILFKTTSRPRTFQFLELKLLLLIPHEYLSFRRPIIRTYPWSKVENAIQLKCTNFKYYTEWMQISFANISLLIILIVIIILLQSLKESVSLSNGFICFICYWLHLKNRSPDLFIPVSTSIFFISIIVEKVLFSSFEFVPGLCLPSPFAFYRFKFSAIPFSRMYLLLLLFLYWIIPKGILQYLPSIFKCQICTFLW